MLKRPASLTVLAFALMAVALSFPLQIMYIYEHSLFELGSIFNKLSFLNYIAICLCFINAFLFLKASPYSLITSPLLLAVMVWNNWWVGNIATDYTLANTSIASFGFLALHGLLLAPKAREILLNPEKRWWRVAKRNRVEVPISVSPWVEEAFKTETFDISETGAFLKSLNTGGTQKIPEGIKPEDFIEIRLKVGSYYQIRCTAQVVRVANENGNYPGGLGIEFKEMTANDQKVLKKYLEQEMTKQHN